MQQASHSSFRHSLNAIGMLMMVFLACCFVRSVLPPLLPTIKTEFSLTHTTATALLLALAAGYSTGMFLTGKVAQYCTHKTIITMAVFLSGTILFTTAFSINVWQLLLGIFCYSFTAGLYFPSGMATLASVTSEQNWGKAIALHETAPNIAYILCPLLIAGLLLITDWRTSMQFLGVLTDLTGFIFWKYGKGGTYKEQPSPKFIAMSLLKRPEVQTLTLLLTIGIILEQTTYSILSLFLVDDLGVSVSSANTLLASSRLANPLTGFASGWLTDRLGARPVIYGVFSITVLALLTMTFANGWILFIALCIQASLPIMFFPALYKILATTFSENEHTSLLSLCVPIGSLTALGIAPLVIGFLGDTIGFRFGFFMLALLTMWGIKITAGWKHSA